MENKSVIYQNESDTYWSHSNKKDDCGNLVAVFHRRVANPALYLIGQDELGRRFDYPAKGAFEDTFTMSELQSRINSMGNAANVSRLALTKLEARMGL